MANDSLSLSGTDGTTMTFPSSSDTVVTLVATQTETNKRITPLANFTIAAPSPSTPTDGQKLILRILSGTTGYAPTWNSIFVSSGVATLPTTALPASKTVTFGFSYNANASKWVLMAVDATGY